MQSCVFEREEKANNCSSVFVFASQIVLWKSLHKPRLYKLDTSQCVYRCVSSAAAAIKITESAVSWIKSEMEESLRAN